MLKPLSTTPVTEPFFGANAYVSADPRQDKCDGGIALNNTDMGLFYQVWDCYVVDDKIMLSAPNTPAFIFHEAINVTKVQLAFDANMAPIVAFIQSGETKIKLPDGLTGNYIIKNLGSSVKESQLTVDEFRTKFSLQSDVILSYLKSDGKLYYRQQRDLFDIEYKIHDGPFIKHTRSGMNKNWRFQFEMRIEVDEYVD